MTTNLSRGIRKLMFFRLLTLAPFISIKSSLIISSILLFFHAKVIKDSRNKLELHSYIQKNRERYSLYSK